VGSGDNSNSIVSKYSSRFSCPSNARRLDEREALDCFILDYIDYCTGMGWFERKEGRKYDDQSEN